MNAALLVCVGLQLVPPQGTRTPTYPEFGKLLGVRVCVDTMARFEKLHGKGKVIFERKGEGGARMYGWTCEDRDLVVLANERIFAKVPIVAGLQLYWKRGFLYPEKLSGAPRIKVSDADLGMFVRARFGKPYEAVLNDIEAKYGLGSASKRGLPKGPEWERHWKRDAVGLYKGVPAGTGLDLVMLESPGKLHSIAVVPVFSGGLPR